MTINLTKASQLINGKAKTQIQHFSPKSFVLSTSIGFLDFAVSSQTVFFY
jgi:hypothetical protein